MTDTPPICRACGRRTVVCRLCLLCDPCQVGAAKPIRTLRLGHEDFLRLAASVAPPTDVRTPRLPGLILDAFTHWVQVLDASPAWKMSSSLDLSPAGEQALQEAMTP